MMNRWLAALGIVSLLIVVFLIPTKVQDLRSDWLTAQAIVKGGDPSQPPSDYASNYGVTEVVPDAHHPRTPGGLLLSLPLAPLPLESLPTVARALLAVEAVISAVLVARFFGWEPWRTLAFLPVYFLSMPGAALVVTGGRSLFVLACIVGALLLGKRGDSYLAGAPVGVATTLKMWPWVLPVALLLAGRRKMAFGAAASFVALNGLGLLLPGVTLAGSVRSLTGGAGWVSHVDNGSLASMLGAWSAIPLQLVLLAVVVWLSRREWETAAVSAIPFAVFLAPLAWPHYLTSVTLPLLWGWRRGSWLPVIALVVSFAWMFEITAGDANTVILVVACLVAARPAQVGVPAHQAGLPTR